MTPERYNTLSQNWKHPTIKITEEEFKQGWHYCVEWDGMLVGPGMPEQKSCLCFVSPGGTCTTCEE